MYNITGTLVDTGNYSNSGALVTDCSATHTGTWVDCYSSACTLVVNYSTTVI